MILVAFIYLKLVCKGFSDVQVSLIYFSLYFMMLGNQLNLFPLNVLILFHMVVSEVY